MLRQLGKFEIRRVLGQGGQSTVFLAHDPQLQREVAIKLLRLGRGQARSALLDEARTAGRLRHPNIAAVHEAGENGDSTHIVFEYVEGRTLDQTLRADGAMEPARAVALMLGVLDALVHAHAAGVVHRDLKPSNIMLDRDGRPRVMDFGIALRSGAGAGDAGARSEALVGTPCYMAPEYIGGGRIAASNDVFAAGLILFEMLFGRRAIDASTDFEALHRIVNEPLVFPPDVFERADEALVDVIGKATARDPQMRYASAAHMLQALKGWQAPAANAGTSTAASGTLEFLLRRMQHRSDFPSMSAAMSAVNRLAQSEQGDAAKLSALILKDFALTNKLLRVANSAHYNTGRGGSVSTVSRAIVVLGFDAVRSLAMSLLLFERIQDKRHADSLKQEFLRAAMSGALARELGPQLGGCGTEEYFVCALFHTLGRLLAHYYLREEALAVETLLAREALDEDLAARRVLGIGYRELGIGVARCWGFPDAILRSMEAAPPPRSPPAMPGDRLQMVSAASHLLCQIVEREPPDQRTARAMQAMKPYAAAMPLPERELRGLMDRAVDHAADLARALQIDLSGCALGRRLAEPAGGKGIDAAMATLAPGAAVDTLAASPPATPPDARAILASGIQDVTQGLLEDVAQADLLRIVVETAYRALGFRRVVLCLRDERERCLIGRYAFGQDGTRPWDRFRVAPGGADLFGLMLARNADLLVHDAAEPKVRERLPAWYLEAFSARSFLLMPLRRGEVAAGMLYADQDTAGGIRIAEPEFALLKTLRNQAVLVLKSAR
jgi:eukaryotic-like serine/threonine-protein kinase